MGADDQPLSSKEGARQEGVCEYTVYRRTWTGVRGVILKSTSRGQRVFISQTDLDDFHAKVHARRIALRQCAKDAAQPKRRRVSEKSREELRATHGVG